MATAWLAGLKGAAKRAAPSTDFRIQPSVIVDDADAAVAAAVFGQACDVSIVRNSTRREITREMSFSRSFSFCILLCQVAKTSAALFSTTTVVGRLACIVISRRSIICQKV